MCGAWKQLPSDGDHPAGAGDHNHARPHKYAGIVSIIGPAVLVLSFVLAWAIFSAMRTVQMEAPFIQRYFPRLDKIIKASVIAVPEP